MTEEAPADSSEEPAPRPAANVETVEQLVRQQLTTALGGPRGVLEAAVPTAAFTLCYVITDELKTALIVAAGLAAIALVVRLVQRSTVQFVMNAAFGIGIGAAFALRASGGDNKDDGALAYFLPGILYNTAYGAVLLLTVLIRWPLVGFMVGAVTGDPTGWRDDRAMVKLCSRLTLLLALPCFLRVAVQYPLYEAGEVGLLGTAKVVMGWPLQVAALAAMVALLARGHTPLSQPVPEPPAAT
ncbi:MAG TPA: DUF3159 domain-containing protein [Sporichthya sp.]|nr:DUF3159 domain-containing protein [Sporichthya sp.]